MREIIKDKQPMGRLFTFICLILVPIYLLFIHPFVCKVKYLLFGWMPMTWVGAYVVLVVWSLMVGIYLYYYWPYKDAE